MKEENKKKLHRYIINQLCLGYCKNEIFHQLCKKFKVNVVHSHFGNRFDVSSQFEHLESGRAIRGYYLKLEHTILINEIHDAYLTVRRGIEARQCRSDENCFLFMITSRYAIDCLYSGDGSWPFVLFDTFYGYTTLLKCERGLFNKVKSRRYPEKGDYFYYFTPDIRFEHYFLVYRLYLNFDKFKCDVVDRQQVRADALKFFPDSKNEDKFIICVSLSGVWYFRRGRRTVKNMLEIDSELLDANFQLILTSIKLEGDRIYGLVDGQNEDAYYTFRKLTLRKMQVTSYDFCRIKKLDGLTVNSRFPTNRVWSDQKCYLVHGFEGTTLRLLEFDLKSEKVREITVRNLFGVVKDMLLDDHGFLTICLVSKEHGQHITRRIPLREPERLQNLALFAVQRRTMSMREAEYGKFVASVPPQLRPFKGYID